MAFRQTSVRDHLSQMHEQFPVPLARLIQPGIAGEEVRVVEPDDMALMWIALLKGLTLLWAMNPQGIA